VSKSFTRRDFIKSVWGMAALIASRGTLSWAERAETLPNIVLIMADDLGYGDIGCYNPESKIPTPTIDSFAQEGVRFTDAHSPSAVCTPTRYGLLTGRYCWRTWLRNGVIEGDGALLIEATRLTLGSMLKSHGYSTACIGKWHLGLGWIWKQGKEPEESTTWRSKDGNGMDYSKPLKTVPLDYGFDYSFVTPGCATDDPLVSFIEQRNVVGTPKFREGKWVVDGWCHEDADTTFVEKAIEFLEDYNKDNANRPFFLYLPLSVPHAPWKPPQFVKGKSQAGLRGDQVVLADWCVQQILKTLKRLKLSDNTLVIFTSDNGPRIGVNGHKSAWKLRGYKSHAWEGGHRIPFIARWPGKIRPKAVSNEPIELTDMTATFAAIAGYKLPSDAGEDIYNILPALLGTTTKHIREALIQHSCWGAFTIRKGKWKLILGTKGSGGRVDPRDKDPDESTPGQLYDMAEDAYETTDLWDTHPEVVAELKALLDKYKKDGRSAPLKRGSTM
jgi:arylsulfatase A